MSLILSEEETMLVDSLRELLNRQAPISRFREMRDSGKLDRHDAVLWRELSHAGFASPQAAPEVGGVVMGYTAAGLVAEQLGRVLAAAPIVSAAMAIELYANFPAAATRVSSIVAGEVIVSSAFDEGLRHAPDHVDTRAIPLEDHYYLTGRKRAVSDGGIADRLIVSAMVGDEFCLFDVAADSAGVDILPLDLIDSRNAADIRLHDVRVNREALLHRGEAAKRAMLRALDIGRAMLSAELLGISQEVFERTVDYLKERDQFGRKIGSFQALQHRAARLYCTLDLTRSVVLKALRMLDSDDPDASYAVSLAKAITARTSREMLNEAVQMHGGIGVTDALDIGLFFKRAMTAGLALGDYAFHSERLGSDFWDLPSRNGAVKLAPVG